MNYFEKITALLGALEIGKKEKREEDPRRLLR